MFYFQVSQLIEWVSQTLAITALYGRNSFPIEKRIGAVFLLHSLYNYQPEVSGGRVRIRVTKATWDDMQELLNILKHREPIDAAYLLLKLMRTNAFDFVAHEVELFPRPSDSSNVAVALATHQSARSRPDDVLNYDSLMQLQSLAQVYHSVKGNILRSYRLGASSIGRSGPSSVISNPTDPSVVSDSIRPAPSLASVALSESQRSLLSNRPFRRALALTSDEFLLQLQARAVELESMAKGPGHVKAKSTVSGAGRGRRPRLLKKRPEPQSSDDYNEDEDNDGGGPTEYAGLSIFDEEQPSGELEEGADVDPEPPALHDLLGLEWPEASSNHPNADDGAAAENDDLFGLGDDFCEVDLGTLGTVGVSIYCTIHIHI